MDISHYIASRRDALAVADYDTYRAQLSHQLLAIRKRLGIATPKREKFTQRDVTAADIQKNLEYAYVNLLSAERAWAHAMHIKSSHSDDTGRGGITGSARGHTISRLSKAAKIAATLVELLENCKGSGITNQDVLEARAYQSSLAGAEAFEKQAGQTKGSRGATSKSSWDEALRFYSIARIIYASLYEAKSSDVYKDALANTIDPTIRYCAYQAGLSRTIPVPVVARQCFPSDEIDLVHEIELIDPKAFQEKSKNSDEDQSIVLDLQNIPNHIEWRGRTANVVDASIGQALATVALAGNRLQAYLVANAAAPARDRASAYDDVLTASQDTVDATKAATDELEKEKLEEGDARMQDLRITSLAVNYDLVSWRVGRNRVLIGADDGISLENARSNRARRRGHVKAKADKQNPRGRQLAQIRERVVLYDATTQSIESVKALPGAMRNSSFVAELDSQIDYFHALKCLNLAYSHDIIGNHVQSLALLQRAHNIVARIALENLGAEQTGPPKLNIIPSAVRKLKDHIERATSRTHGLVETHELQRKSGLSITGSLGQTVPLVANLRSFPATEPKMSTHALVDYPPRVATVPVKPLFLDVAWNYIEYPGRTTDSSKVMEKPSSDVSSMPNAASEEKNVEKKKGWFGFGR